MGIAATLIGAAVHQGFGSEMLVSAATAGVVCWLAGSLALAAAYVGNVLQSPVQGVLLGMLARLGLPMAALLILPSFREGAATRGATYTILGVYLVALVVETILALQMVPRSSRGGLPVKRANAEGVSASHG